MQIARINNRVYRNNRTPSSVEKACNRYIKGLETEI